MTFCRTSCQAPGLLLALACLAAAASAQDRGPDPLPWPFGVDPAARSMNGPEERDLFNLGLLGAKARDADRAPVRATTGLRQIEGGGGDGKDDGPRRLLVEILFPGGPAEKAGLRAGDVITGAGGQSFAEGCLAPLAAALRKAEAQAKGTVALEIERQGKKGLEKLKLNVGVPTGGAEAAKPTAGKPRRAILLKAAEWLAAHQNDDGGFRETLSGVNGAVVQSALAGLAWLSTGLPKHQPAIDKSKDFVLRQVDAPDRFGNAGVRGGANWNQSNWGYVHAALFLAELQVRKPSALVKKELQRIATEIGARQEKSGGWAHGPGGKNALDYLELNIVSGLALSALGAAQQAGCQVDRAVVDRAVAYLEASASGEGGVGYSTHPGQKGQGNIGRTAAAWLGAENLGLGRQPFCARMRDYVERSAGDVLGGHASLMQHVLLAGVAAQAHGPQASKLYFDAVERDLVLARAPDGSLQPRPWHESISMGSNSDVSFGEVWTTAAWSIVLGADPKENKGGGLLVWTGHTRVAKR